MSANTKRNEEMTSLCDSKDVEKDLKALHEILTISNTLTAKIQAADKLNKKDSHWLNVNN